MVRKTWFALAVLAAIGVTFGASPTAEAGQGRGGQHGRHDYHRHHDHHHHHHHHAGYRGGYGYGGYGFGQNGPTNVRSIYGPAYHSYYGTRYTGYGAGYGYGGRGYDRCDGPSYGRGGVSFSIGF
jgi:hypothetical protein